MAGVSPARVMPITGIGIEQGVRVVSEWRRLGEGHHLASKACVASRSCSGSSGRSKVIPPISTQGKRLGQDAGNSLRNSFGMHGESWAGEIEVNYSNNASMPYTTGPGQKRKFAKKKPNF
jgi:hypothetical protein